MKKVVKKVLESLHKDKVIDCNEYQGKDFDSLLEKVAKGIQREKKPCKYYDGMCKCPHYPTGCF